MAIYFANSELTDPAGESWRITSNFTGDNNFVGGNSMTNWEKSDDVYGGGNLSNKGSSNDVDGTWGDYTIQEGESDLFLINNRSGKKYKFNLTEVS